jgi:hypothetical protein
MYNSFRGPVLAAAFERIRKSVENFPRHVRIAYVTSMLPEFFLHPPGIRVLKKRDSSCRFDRLPFDI